MTTSIRSAIQTQQAAIRRQVITQTITNDDYTTTAVVTLGPGEPSSTPLDSPPASSGGSEDSGGLSSGAVGILIGSIVGAIILALLLWMCCFRKRMDDDDYDDGTEYHITEYDMIQQPQRVLFPHSIPPPPVPTYKAVPIRRVYTSNNAARRDPSTFVIYTEDDDQSPT
ncbi:hypothetical protein NPX13_g2751 [Xylaria arbuscula]|uniref:Mid2 domain-containing protein n=1 Tax=Xylaria arbuscula TaxID=114810 RepID=A0A9W8NJ69_9PEZI|nr:hypothetical protein NPX13_g2751 [Xylaria arbuscula]